VLVLRWGFGLTGQALINGAVGAGCSRCTALAIDGHLEPHTDGFDIDGDGEMLPLEDGVLVMRWLFGFRGEALIDGVIDQSECTRCSVATIEEYLAGIS
jgi:hypothetical protein